MYVHLIYLVVFFLVPLVAVAWVVGPDLLKDSAAES